MSEIPSPAAELNAAQPLSSAEHNAWRLVNHGLAWAMLGVMILALAGLSALIGEAIDIIRTATNSYTYSGSSGGKNMVLTNVMYIVASIGGLLGLIALTSGLALSGALSPVRPARWLAFASLAASYTVVYSIVSAIGWYHVKAQYGGRSNEAEVHTVTSITLVAMALLVAILLGQALLATLAHAWNDQKTIGRIKWYLKYQFALPALLLAVGFGCGLSLASNVATIIIVAATLATYVFLAMLLIRNIYLLHRGILWQLHPELVKVAPPPPPPKPVIDPLAD